MAFKCLFRLDDIAPNMHWENYERIKEIFNKYEIQPIIGVIPENRDSELLAYPKRENQEFWQEIRERRQAGWDIAIHGFQHVYETEDSGMLGLNPRSEFAGLSYDRQLEKLQKATKIFEERQIAYSAFMAPSHSYDLNTLKALKDVGIQIVTDGYALHPYSMNNIQFIPQLFAMPRKMPFGFYTFCLHPNILNEYNFKKIENFLEHHSQSVVSLPGAVSMIRTNPVHSISKNVFGSLWRFLRTIKTR